MKLKLKIAASFCHSELVEESLAFVQRPFDKLRVTFLNRKKHDAAFTLVELLTSIGVLILLIALLAASFNAASRAWLQSEKQVETGQQARAFLDLIARDLSQALVNSNVTFYGSCDSIAFVAAVSDKPESDRIDLVEIVYRPDPPEDPSYVCLTARPRGPAKIVRRYTPAFGGGSINLNPNWDFYQNVNNWPATYDPDKVSDIVDGVVFFSFTYFSTNGTPYPAWTSRAVTGQSWPELGNPIGTATDDMKDRAPSAVQIDLHILDTRALARLANAPDAARRNITNEATQVFTTFVTLPTGR